MSEKKTVEAPHPDPTPKVAKACWEVARDYRAKIKKYPLIIPKAHKEDSFQMGELFPALQEAEAAHVDEIIAYYAGFKK